MEDGKITKKLARITKCDLCIDPVLHAEICVDYDDFSSQFILRNSCSYYDKEAGVKKGTEYGTTFIIRLMEALNIEKLSDAVGRTVWVHGTGDRFDFMPIGISGLCFDGGHTFMVDELKHLTNNKE